MKQFSVAGLAVTAVIASAQSIGVEVNSEPVNFANQPPVYIGGRVLVPLRGVFERLGANVDWQPANRTVLANNGTTNISLRIGDRTATVNGQSLAMDVPAQIINGSTMVPIRFVSEALGAQVDWNSASRTVMIFSTTQNPNPPVTRPPVTRPPVTRPPVTRPPVVRPPVRPPVRPTFPVYSYLIPRGTVLPARLQTRVSSRDSRRGDLVRATVNEFRTGTIDWERSLYDFPPTTYVEGRVTYVSPRRNNQPGMIELNFTRLVMPNGNVTQINSSLIALDDRNTIRNSNGVYMIQNGRYDDRMIFAGYGDRDEGLIVGLPDNRPITSGGLGSILSHFGRIVDTDRRRTVRDVVLPAGTRFGLRLNRDINVKIRRWN